MERNRLHRQLYEHVREDCDTGFFKIKDSGFLYFDQLVTLLASSMPPFVKDPETHARAEMLFYLERNHPLFCYLEKGIVLFLVGYSPMPNQAHHYELIPFVIADNLPSAAYQTFLMEWLEEQILSLHGRFVFHVFVTNTDNPTPPLKSILLDHGYHIIKTNMTTNHSSHHEFQSIGKTLLSSNQMIQ